MKRISAVRYFLLVVMTTGVFLVLYRRFLFGNGVYLFTDIGSDSFSSSYPVLCMLSEKLHNLDFSVYTLWSGLGMDTSVTFLQYLNPLKLLVILFRRQHLIYGILLQLYLQTVLTAVFGCLYFQKVLKDSPSAVLCAIIWAFSSYNVVWSQNLSYGTCITMFTILLYLTELCLTDGKLFHWLLFTGTAALFLITNYFFFYMSCFFLVIYVILHNFFCGQGIRSLASSVLRFAATACGALVLCAVMICAVYGSFTSSARVGDVSRPITFYLEKGLQLKELPSIFSRFLSTDLLGTGNAYTGSANYYEMALLFTSSLLFFAWFYLLQKKNFRRRLIIGTLTAAAILLVPVLRYAANLNWRTMRFSFMHCLAAILVIGFFVRDLFHEGSCDHQALIRSVIMSAAAIFLFFPVLFFTDDRLGIAVSSRALKMTLMFFSAYGLLLLVYVRITMGNVLHHTHLAKQQDAVFPLDNPFLSQLVRIFPFLLIISVCGEMIVMNNDSLNHRDYILKDHLTSAYYNDGTQRAISLLRQEDESLYRISSTKSILYANEGMVDHFPSTTLYNNTNPGSLLSLEEAHKTAQQGTAFFSSSYTNYLQFTLLSGKYLVNDTELRAFEPSLFKEVSSPMRVQNIYENRSVLPFGYLYTNQIPEAAFSEADAYSRMLLLTKAWYETEGEEEGLLDEASAYDCLVRMDLGSDDWRQTITSIRPETHNVEYTLRDGGYEFKVTGEDPYVYFNLPDPGIRSDTVRYLHLKVETDRTNSGMFYLYYLEDAEAEPQPSWNDSICYNSRMPESLTLLPDGVAAIRFDLDESDEKVFLSLMEVITCGAPSSHFRELADTQISDISFEKDTYRAQVHLEDAGGMLCIPLLYSKNWTAAVNGETVTVHNINGGLCGVPLSGGTCEVTMTYKIPRLQGYAVISILAFLVWILLIIYTLSSSLSGRSKLSRSSSTTRGRSRTR